MRIAVDARVLEPPCPTGVERAAAEMLRALPGVLAPGDDLLVFGWRLPVLPGGPTPSVHAVALGGSEAPLVWRESHLAPALRDQGVDVLWSPVAAIPIRTTVPRVATVHEVPWAVRPRMEGVLREHAHRIRLRLAAEVAARIVCPSRAAAAQVVQFHPKAADRVRIVPHAVPVLFREPMDPSHAQELRARSLAGAAPYLLHVGGARERKNLPLLFKAYARYRLRGGQAQLVLAGPGDPPEKPTRGVVPLGYVADDVLVALYDGAVAVIVSSESEGFGLPVLEAMARGAPVVAAEVGGIAEAARDAALLVPAGDDEALSAAMFRVETDPVLRARLASAGRARAEGSRWSDSARLLRDVLTEAVEASARK